MPSFRWSDSISRKYLVYQLFTLQNQRAFVFSANSVVKCRFYWTWASKAQCNKRRPLGDISSYFSITEAHFNWDYSQHGQILFFLGDWMHGIGGTTKFFISQPGIVRSPSGYTLQGHKDNHASSIELQIRN